MAEGLVRQAVLGGRRVVEQRWRLPGAGCVFGRLQARGVRFELQLTAADGRPLRRFRSDWAEPLPFEFCAEAGAELGARIRALGGGGLFRVLIERVVTERAVPPARPPALLSPRLIALQAELARGGDTQGFWREVAASGAPLIEALDSDSALVTFLFRGRRDTRNVRISWPAWTGPFADAWMARLGGSEVWWRSLRLPRATRMSYQLAPDVPAGDEAIGERVYSAAARADPLNPTRLRSSDDDDDFAARSLLVLPDAPPERWVAAQPGVAKGSLEHLRLRSRRLGNERWISVYLPARQRPDRGAPAAKHPLVIVFDRERYLREIPAPAILDNLIAAGRIPPLVAALVGNPARRSRELELPCNPAFAEFIASELWPWLQRRYPVAADRRRVALAGSSFGGLAAAFVASRHPERFGLVSSQSGSFWWSPPKQSGQFDGADKPGWLVRRFAELPFLDLRFYLDAGRFEAGEHAGGVLESTAALRDLLRARGYDVDARELDGGHDDAIWRNTFADGLISLFGAAQ